MINTLNTTENNYYLIPNTSFSGWAYLPFMEWFTDTEELALDFTDEDFDPDQ